MNTYFKQICSKALLLFGCISVAAQAEVIGSAEYKPTRLPDTAADQWLRVDTTGVPGGVYGILPNDADLGYSDALYLDSSATLGGSYFWRAITASHATDKVTLEAKVRLISANSYGLTLSIRDDFADENLTIFPDKIQLYYTGSQYFMDTTNGYHVYKIVTNNGQIQVFVDSAPNPVITANFSYYSPGQDNRIMFGDISSTVGPKASIAYVKYSVER